MQDRILPDANHTILGFVPEGGGTFLSHSRVGLLMGIYGHQ
jgi:hypothetical protein